MAEIAVERDFAASADAVWEKLGNFGEMGWMPGVASCEVEGEGLGSIRKIAMGPATVVERLEAHDDAGRILSYSITEGPIPVQNYLATITVSESGSGCRQGLGCRCSLQSNGRHDATTLTLDTQTCANDARA